jgi:hypothetical protein
MPQLDLSEDQILELLGQLSPGGRREAIRRLIAEPEYLRTALERNRPRIEALARSQGLERQTMTEDQRQAFIEKILHE